MAIVSVIIITYNRANLLGGAINSVLRQTFQDFELIVVDDASKDNTAEVVRSFGDERIRYIRHETNTREAGARNTGVQNSSGEYIAFLDDDDEWLPEKLQKQVDLLNSSPAVVGGVYTGFLKIDSATGKTLVQIVPRKRGNIFLDMFVQNWVGTPSTVLLRKECFDKVGFFDEELIFGNDYDMWIRISKEFRFEYISDPLVNYYVHDNNISTNYDIVIRGMEICNRKYEKLFGLHRKHHSDRFHTIGVFYCLIGNVRKGREALLTAIRLYPFDVRYYFRLFVSLLGAESFKKTNDLKERVTAWIKK